MTAKWIRQCQECGHKQNAKCPTSYAKGSDAWREVKCQRCKSPALNYGAQESTDEETIESEWGW